MKPELEEEILEILRTRLSIAVETTSVYVGGDQMYQDQHKVSLMLDGEVISETYGF